MSNLLEIRDLRIEFETDAGPVVAVDRLNLDIGEGEVVGLVGESGSGKSVTAMSILKLLPGAPHCRVSGSVRFDGVDLLSLSERQLRDIRGGEISMIFQEPMTSLNPTFTVGDQIGEVIRMHERKGNRAIRERVVELLTRVGIPAPHLRFNDFPHQLSGGMRQRVMIAMALAVGQKLLLADEPTTALDVTVQAQIVELLRELQADHNLAILMVTHNMGVVAEIADRVVVLYAGQMVESGPVERVFRSPEHPYTEGLLASVPDIDRDTEQRMRSIPGSLPDPHDRPPACIFAPRCPRHRPVCDLARPPLRKVHEDHDTACLKPFGYPSPVTEAVA